MHRLSVLVFLLVGLAGYGQSQAEKDLLKTAEKQFEAKEFLAALPAYRQLVSISPQDRSYNFKYGTCLLYSDEDVSEAVKHLQYSCRNGNFEDPRAYFYLGKALHLNYQFADALDSYEDFNGKAEPKLRSAFREVDRLITMAENGQQLLSDIKDIRVLDKTESTVGEFFRNYDLSEMGGSIIKVPEELLSSQDKKREHSPLMYFPDGGGEIIFSSYGKSGDHLDLYTVRRTSGGGFSSPEKLAGVVNSPFDEDFPFLHSDGRTLYFSSKGHNSMGGYDIFQSKRNLSTGLFESPENLDFAISTPDDDIFYVVDPQKRVAHFASTRNSEDGRLHVYQVAVSNASMELAIVKGKLSNEIGGSKAAQIKVIDANTNDELGVYRTDENGEYLIDLPGTGKYKFYIDVEDSDLTHTGFVDVPSFGTMKAFKQNMELTEVSSQEKLIIKNHFDEEPSEGALDLAQEILKQKASLDVNFSGDLASEEEVAEEFNAEKVIEGAGFAQGTSMESVLAMAYTQAEDVSDRIDDESQERDRAYTRSQEMAKRSEELMKEATALYERVQSESDPRRKEELMVQTSLKRAEASSLRQEAAVSLLLANELEKVTTSNKEDLLALNTRNQGIETALAESNAQAASDLLFEVKSADDKGSTQIDALESTTKISLDRKRESQQILGRFEEIQDDRDRIVGNIKTKETLLSKTKKQKEKNLLIEEISALESEKTDIEEQLIRASDRLEDVQSEAETTSSAVTLLEKMRMGEDLELMAIRPMAIPTGGLRATEDRLALIQKSGMDIRLSDEEIARVMAKRPDLITGFSPEQRLLLSSHTSIDIDNLPTGTDIEEPSDVASASDLTEELAEDLSQDLSDTGQDDTEQSDVNQRTEELTEATSGENEPSSTEGEGAFNNPSEEATHSVDTEVESSLNLDQLLEELQADYSSALGDIEQSSMDPVSRAEAKIDLNRAVVSQLEDHIASAESEPGFEEDVDRQENVSKMNELIANLEAEMLDIAKASESESDEGATASNELPSLESSNPDFGQALTETGLSSEMEEHYQKISEIDADLESSDLVRSSAKVKELVSFVQETRTRRDELIKSENATDASIAQDIANVDVILSVKKEEIEREIANWEEKSGLTLTEHQSILAANYPNYTVERAIIESTGEADAILELDERASKEILDSSQDWSSVEEDPLLAESERSILEGGSTTQSASEAATAAIEAAGAAMDEAVTSSESEAEESALDISFLGDTKDWAKNLFDNKSSETEALRVQDQFSDLVGLTVNERQVQEAELIEAFTTTLDEEFLAKEEVMAYTIEKQGSPSEEVVALMEESYRLDRAASQIREGVAAGTLEGGRETNLKKALLLDLKALDKMNEATALHGHLGKRKELSEFQFSEAIVIDINEILPADELLSAESSDASDSDEQLRSSSTESEDAQTIDPIDVEIPTEESTDAVEEELGDSQTNTTTDSAEEALSEELTESNELSIKDVDQQDLDDRTEDVVDTSLEGSDVDETGEDIAQGEETPEIPALDSDVNEQLGEETQNSVEENTGSTNSAEIPAEELARVPEIKSQEDLDTMELLDGNTAIRTYPQTSAQLTEIDILPILTYEEEMSLFQQSPEDVDLLIEDEGNRLTEEELSTLKIKGAELSRAKRYQSVLGETIDSYQEEIKTRRERAAVVIDIIEAGNGTLADQEELSNLTAEIQVIEAYVDQGRSNQFDLNLEISELIAQQQEIIDASSARAERTDDVAQVEESTSQSEDVVNEPVAEDLAEVSEEDSPAIPETEPQEKAFDEEPSDETAAEEVIPTATPSYSEEGIPSVLVEDMFSISEDGPHAESRVLMDVDLPDGEVYQVQVGAFRNPIPEEHFAEFDPIMGERLASGITRYKVGLFMNRNTAVQARDKVRALGYRDAFVVRYMDGSRTGIGAEAVASGQSTNSPAVSSSSTAEVDTQDNVSTGTPSEVDLATSSSARDAEAYYNAFDDAAPATQVEKIDGLFYTVQVGVYSKPVTLSNIFDITPLNSDLLPNGLIKYTTGIFDDPEVADQWKQKIIEKGVTDAFVTAYYNGNRVSLSRAAQIQEEEGSQVLVKISELDELDTDRQGQAVWEMVSTSELFKEEVRDQIEFKIRMGPYFDRIPDKDVKVILDFEDNVEYSRRDDNAIIYTTKGGMSYEEAQKWRTTFLEKGITNANIIAMQDGNEIPVKQALDFLLK